MTVVNIECSVGTAKMDLRNRNEHIQKWWAAGRFYEPKMLEYIRSRYSGGTFIDAGACIGNHTVFFALFCNARVLAIEPVEWSIARAQHNVALNDLSDKVIFEHCAISDQPGMGKMIDSAPDWHLNYGMHQLVSGDEVRVETLDNLVEKHKLDDVTLLKLDVEHKEIEAFKGATGLLFEQRPAIFVECPTVDELADTIKLLAAFGYRKRSMHNPTPTFEFTCEKD